MNHFTPGLPDVKGVDALEARFALRVAARLEQLASDVEPDIGERLRVAREQALERARSVRAIQRQAEQEVAFASRSGAAVLGGGPSGWWIRLGSIVPIIALLLGLLLIEQWHSRAQISAAAEIDADLLADDLPPDAYSDDGFAEFLKTPRD